MEEREKNGMEGPGPLRGETLIFSLFPPPGGTTSSSSKILFGHLFFLAFSLNIH